MLNFPNNPTLNQTYKPTETTWSWDGSAWDVIQPTINIAGDATGSIIGNTISITLIPKVTAGTYGNFTVDAAGRITSARAINSSDISTALGYTPIGPSGGTITGSLLLTGAITQAQQAATKAYVDSRALFALAVGIY